MQEVVQLEETEGRPRRLYTAGLVTGSVAVSGVGVWIVEAAPHVGDKIIGGVFVVGGALVAAAIGGIYYTGDTDISPHRLPNAQSLAEHIPAPTE